MEIITSYEAKLTKQLNTTPIPEGVFRVSPQIKKSRIIEFFGDLYTYPPRFNIKWDSIDELHNDLFMSYNYRALEHSLPFMDILTSLSQDEKNVENGTYSTNAYIEGYMNKIVSTRFYRKQTKKIQESLQTIPIYVILNGQGNIVLANSTDQLETSPNNFNSLLYNFCGNFDHLAEKNSQLGLFFVSRDDAEQYLQEIAKSDTEGTKMFGLSIHCFGLDFAYRVMRDHHPEIDFRIIPELTEVQKLLTKETSNSNFIFENDQQQLRSRLRPIASIPILNKSEIINSIKKKINEIGFEKAAKQVSISSSAIDGGIIGLVNSTVLTKNISENLKNLKIGDISKPIINPNSILFLKIIDKKNNKAAIANKEEYKKELINTKKNQLLNLYSSSYLSKLKNNSSIEFR